MGKRLRHITFSTLLFVTVLGAAPTYYAIGASETDGRGLIVPYYAYPFLVAKACHLRPHVVADDGRPTFTQPVNSASSAYAATIFVTVNDVGAFGNSIGPKEVNVARPPIDG